ncbi:TetR/AcrR family transcriptional regulator [Paraconexibacter algicola]|uniref:HTH tetR-type domain-containing protein n=1 Tax=Paraconexibacter algicola TaxID=2133960 RepID=A0A2T4UF17_9ACTN|nr:TetR family transcriptional regulator [Paraconexibacter algicola]PTL56365.1 hypothetical protein C7Y72_15470 [Paraconexibacter algicola]
MSTPKGTARRAEIVAAAGRVLVRDGIDAVHHRAVAGEAGIGLGTATYHFPAAEELRAAALRALADADVARMASAAGRVPLTRRDPRDAAAVLVGLLLPEHDDELVAWCERWARGARRPDGGDDARRVRTAARALVSDVLGRSGRATAPPADLVLAIVDGAVLGALAEGQDAERARARAVAALAFVLHER